MYVYRALIYSVKYFFFMYHKLIITKKKYCIYLLTIIKEWLIYWNLFLVTSNRLV